MSSLAGEFDERLFTLKLSALAREMNAETHAARRQRGAPKKQIDAELEILRRHLNDVDQICRDIWQMQGRFVTQEFLREIVVPKIEVCLASRVGALRSYFELNARRTGADATLSLRLLDRAKRQIESVTSDRYEIEACELGYSKPGDSDTRALENAKLDPSNTEQPTAIRVTRCPPTHVFKRDGRLDRPAAEADTDTTKSATALSRCPWGSNPCDHGRSGPALSLSNPYSGIV